MRQRTNTPELGEVEEPSAEAPIALDEIPRPPAGLLKKTRESWYRYFESAAMRVTVVALDLDMLERLWLLYDERSRAQIELRKARVVEGSQGQMRASPFYGVLSKLDSEIRQLEDRVAKSMKSRLTLGLVVSGDGRTDDADDEPRHAAGDDGDDDGPATDPRLYLVDRPTG
jgi:hypothetical protein